MACADACASNTMRFLTKDTSSQTYSTAEQRKSITLASAWPLQCSLGKQQLALASTVKQCPWSICICIMIMIIDNYKKAVL